MKLRTAPAERKKLLFKLAVVAALLLAVACFVLRGVDLRALAERYAETIGRAGPWAFFVAMALLPAVGFPILGFTLIVGPIFGARLGMGAVVAASLAAVTVNLLLTYWLARRALRPWFARMLPRLGYALPEVAAADMTDLIVIVRVTPGPPFFVQNYLLGLADAPLGRYLGISCVVTWTYNTTIVLFGDALIQGKGELAAVAVSALIALAAATHLVRRHYAGQKKAA